MKKGEEEKKRGVGGGEGRELLYTKSIAIKLPVSCTHSTI
jgi:hypothetical protein